MIARLVESFFSSPLFLFFLGAQATRQQKKGKSILFGLPLLLLFIISLLHNFAKQRGCCGVVYLHFHKIAYLVSLTVENGGAVLLGAAEELLARAF